MAGSHMMGVFFYKRAQIFVGDVYGALQGKGLGAFHDIQELTMFADYRVPVVLRVMGILEFSSELESKVSKHDKQGGLIDVQLMSHALWLARRAPLQLNVTHALLHPC
eukprot:927260-Pelagomonas_calceolata.AAC.4